jgi:hypothetical protein
MQMTFSDVVEAVKNLSGEEKEELKYLVEQYLREEKREEIYQNYLSSKKKEQEGKLHFSDDIDELMDSLED